MGGTSREGASSSGAEYVCLHFSRSQNAWWIKLTGAVRVADGGGDSTPRRTAKSFRIPRIALIGNRGLGAEANSTYRDRSQDSPLLRSLQTSSSYPSWSKKLICHSRPPGLLIKA